MVGFWKGKGGQLKQPDKLPVDLPRVINYHPGKGLGQLLSLSYSGVPETSWLVNSSVSPLNVF